MSLDSRRVGAEEEAVSVRIHLVSKTNPCTGLHSIAFPHPFAKETFQNKSKQSVAEALQILHIPFKLPKNCFGRDKEEYEGSGRGQRKVDVRLSGKGNSNSHGARPVHLIITMMKWMRTSRLSIKKSYSEASGTGLEKRRPDLSGIILNPNKNIRWGFEHRISI